MSQQAGLPQGDLVQASEKIVHQGEHCNQSYESITDTTVPEHIPRIRTKKTLAILAVSGIYFAQVYCLVGAGAVSTCFSSFSCFQHSVF